jgi:hypothetical protein
MEFAGHVSGMGVRVQDKSMWISSSHGRPCTRQFGNSSGLFQSSHLLAIYGAELHGGVRRVLECKAMILT